MSKQKIVIYQIRVKEQVGDQWAEWFSPLVISNEANGEAKFTGTVRDQAELHGLLNKVRDLNLTLLSVDRIEHPKP
jgi:hypothetical protein